MTTSDPSPPSCLARTRATAALVEGAARTSPGHPGGGRHREVIQQTNKAWVAASVSVSLLAMLGLLFHLITTGVGVWGNNNPSTGAGPS